jgi:hypothetical protein
MKRTISGILAMFIAVMALGPANFATHADAADDTVTVRIGDQDFTLVNKTGVEIYAVYVSPHDADEWGEDILGRDTLPNNESVLIKFSRKEKAKNWDLRIEDKKGDSIEWENFDLLEISTIKLYYKNGKATATVE